MLQDVREQFATPKAADEPSLHVLLLVFSSQSGPRSLVTKMAGGKQLWALGVDGEVT